MGQSRSLLNVNRVREMCGGRGGPADFGDLAELGQFAKDARVALALQR